MMITAIDYYHRTDMLAMNLNRETSIAERITFRLGTHKWTLLNI